MLKNQVEMNAIELQKVGEPSVASMKAIVKRFGSAYSIQKKAKKNNAGNAAARMLASFASNALVRSEPSVFGASVSSLVAPAKRINTRKETVKNLAAYGVVRQEVAPFGVSVQQIAGVA